VDDAAVTPSVSPFFSASHGLSVLPGHEQDPTGPGRIRRNPGPMCRGISFY
jgi:hypothetical protein